MFVWAHPQNGITADAIQGPIFKTLNKTIACFYLKNGYLSD